MAEVNISINGRTFGIACDDGQEQRVMDLANFVDSRLREIAAAGAGTNESHLLVLTSIVMADELFDMRDAAANGNRASLNGLQITKDDEGQIINAIDQMASRIEAIAGGLAKV
ncbi:MAG TPA: cell division protein ZapA [Alphaproteobacteria bacterium]|nr:cell division protein ZapA [Alphaproteobacteria bacterium]